MFAAGRGEPRADLADRLSEVQDGFLDQSALEAQFCDEPTFHVTSGGTEGPVLSALAALGNYEEGLTTFDTIAEACAFEDHLLNPLQAASDAAAGTPWPTPYKDPVFTDSGIEIPSADLGTLGVHEWELQARLTRNLTSLSGLSSGGADDELDLSVAGGALEGLGALAESQPSNPKVKAYRKVVASAALAGTPQAGKTAQELIKKSMQIASLADDRMKAAAEARAGYRRTLKEIDTLDQRAQMLARQLVDATGQPRKDLTLMDIERLKKLRARSIALGRRAVRYQKINALATPLAQNGVAQAALLQMTASTVLTGDVGATAALGSMYHAIGKKSEQIRGIRAKQLAKWEQKEGLEGFAATISFHDPYEAELNAIERADLALFAGLEWSFRKAFRKVKKGFKKVGKGIKSVAKTTASVVKEVGKTTGKLVKAVAYTPIEATVKAAKRAAKGDIKGAFKAIGNSVRSQAKDIANVAGKFLLDYPCQISNSKLGKAAIGAAAQAVGTAVGGTVGGSVGSEAARQATTINKSVCGGFKNLGLTKGTFRPGRVKSTFKSVGKTLYKTTFSPKALLGAVSRIGQDALTGGVNIPGVSQVLPVDSSKLLDQFGGKALKQLGVGQLAGRAQVLQRIAPRVTTAAGKFVTKQAKKQVKKAVRSAVREVVPSEVRKAASIVPQARGFIQRPASIVPRVAQARGFFIPQIQRPVQRRYPSVQSYVGRIGDFL
jgi:hypothetical protein